MRRCGSGWARRLGWARRPGGSFPAESGQAPARPSRYPRVLRYPPRASRMPEGEGEQAAGQGAACLSSAGVSFCRRLARVTVLHDCLGCRTFELPPSAAVRDVKARIEAEGGFPCAEQRLWHRGREVRRGSGDTSAQLVASHTAVVLEVPTGCRLHPAGCSGVCDLRCEPVLQRKEVVWTSS